MAMQCIILMLKIKLYEYAQILSLLNVKYVSLLSRESPAVQSAAAGTTSVLTSDLIHLPNAGLL